MVNPGASWGPNAGIEQGCVCVPINAPWMPLKTASTPLMSSKDSVRIVWTVQQQMGESYIPGLTDLCFQK